MGPLGRVFRRREAIIIIPHLRELLNWNGLCSVLTFRPLVATRWASSALPSPTAPSRLREQRQRTVAVFWDLDNKPPKRVNPFEAAIRLKEMAGRFGDVVDVVAYANHHAFAHVPTWVHEERRQRKVLDLLESTGEVKPDQPYICGVCGAKKKTHVQLTAHFKMLHEREHRKRMNRLDSLKSKKKQKQRFLDNHAKKMAKYKEASRSVIYPKVGYGLMQDIRRAGVFVRTVKDEPQAADIALKDHMMRSIKKGVNCICLVSDDTDFKPELKMARERRLHTVVVGDLKILGAYADTYFSWAEVASGRAEQKAKLINGQLVLREISSSELAGLTVDEYEPEEIREEEESEWGSDSDGEERWRPVDGRFDDEWDDDFDSFSDEFSGSDSEEAERESDGKRRSKLHGCLTGSTFSINSRVPPRWRAFTTTREIVHNEESRNGSFSTIEEPSTGEGCSASKPERLHHFFTMLQNANKGHSSTKVTSATNRADAEGEIDTQHFNKVQDILKSFTNEEEKTSTKDHDMGETTKTHLQQLDEDVFDSTVLEKQGDGLDFNEEHEVPTSSTSDYKDDVFVGLKMRRRHKRTGPGKSRIKMTPTGPVKITRIGPRPFYLSGFASESQKDCDAVNKYFAEWWCNERRIYRGRQDRKRKQ